MEWDMASWGLEEVEGGPQPTSVGIGSVVAPSSGPKSGSDCSVVLKLGGFGCSQVRGEQQRVAAVPGTLKRARTPGGGSQSAACMVDGCAADLSCSKEYHRRHKVCEVHSKTPVVMVGGQEQRFCQQCSRFHLLGEFDEVKRSCRKRLDGHNRRRRKPRPEPLTVSRFLLNFQDPRYPSVPAIRSTAAPHPGWTSEMKIGDGGHASSFYGRQQFAPLYPNSFKEGKPNPFSQGISATVSSGTMIGGTSSVRHPFVDCFSFSEGSGGSSKIFSDGLSQVLDSDCALSLLSSPTHISSINLGRVVSANHVPMSQPLPQGSRQHRDVGQASNKLLDTRFTCPGTDGNPVNTIVVSHAGNADIHCHGMLHVSAEGSTNGSSHALPFSWQ